jgi:folliculin
MFGDEKHGYLLSYLFKVRDDQARGSQRVYSINFLMTDRHYLVASFTYLVRYYNLYNTFIHSN